MLTEKQKRFCEEYIKDLNGTQAAIRAGYSKKTANAQGGRLLLNVKVQAEIAKLREAQSRRNGIEADQVLQELARIGFSDPRRILDESGDFLPMSDWPDDIAAAVSSIDRDIDLATKRPYIKKIRFWNKNNALDLIGRHLGMFDKNNTPDDEPRKIAADIRAALAEMNERTAASKE